MIIITWEKLLVFCMNDHRFTIVSIEELGTSFSFKGSTKSGFTALQLD